jgi:DsbC/DsbD-like thiol-disulfide interchange protein
MRHYTARKESSAMKKMYAPYRLLLIAMIMGLRGTPLIASEASAWQKLTQSSLRLISAGGLEADGYHAAIEIALSGQALTYWRTPGDVGVAPELSDDGSDNLEGFHLSFPAPQRYTEAGAEAYGYKDHVLLPLRLMAKDKAAPLNARLHLTYAVCENICIPVDAKLALNFSPHAARTSLSPDISSAEAAVPQIITVGPLLTALKAPKQQWAISLPATMGSMSDVFVESPDQWFFATLRSPQGPLIELEQSPALLPPDIAVRITITTPHNAYEWPTKLHLEPSPIVPKQGPQGASELR